ncbi:MAG: CaiB/BaiF CoA transferase family protein [Acidimicrobiales bacterium]
MSSSNGPLTGIKVVDFTHIVAGPLCTELLADGGAEVVKIEPPGGEWARNRGARVPTRDGGTISSYFSALNRGKQSVVLNLKSPDGARIARDLISEADICIWNFLEGTMERLGLGAAAIREGHPRLITAAITFLGDSSALPTPSRPGLAIVAESESGHTSMHRDADGRPIRGDLPIGDACTGMAAYGAIATALFERERTGRGRHVSISMVLSLLVLNSTGITGQQMKPRDLDLSDIGTAGYGLFPASDGHVAIGVNSDRLFRRVSEVIGRPELADDPRFASFVERDLRFLEVNAMIEEWSSARTRREIFDALNAGGVPVGVVNTPAAVLGDSVFRQLGYFLAVDDGFGTAIDVPANPFGWNHAAPVIPRAGEHTERILSAWLGLDHVAVEDLAAKGAFGSGGSRLSDA